MTLYIAKNDQKLGPYSIAEAQSLIVAGTIQATDWAWYEGLTDWIPLNQVPGFDAAAPQLPGVPQPPPPPVGRPVLVWVICIFYFIGIPLGILSAILLAALLASGSVPIPKAQQHFLHSLSYVHYCTKALNYALVLTWAILLFRLKRQSLYFLLASLALAALTLIYSVFAKDWFAAAGVLGLFLVAVGWAFNFALLYYNWHLFRKGVLR